LFKIDPGEHAVHVEMLFEIFTVTVIQRLILVHPPATAQYPGRQEQRLSIRMNPSAQTVHVVAPIEEFTIMHRLT
jgi:hypothetical protein